MQPTKPRVLIECTPTYSTNLLTGIQRVVRSIVKASQSISDAEVIPVIWVNGKLYVIQVNDESVANTSSKGLISKLLKIQFFIRLKDRLRKNFSRLFVMLRSYYLLNRASKLVDVYSENVSLRNGDILLFLDGNWGRDDIVSLRDLAKLLNVSICYVLYDLIPVLHPDYCDVVKTNEFSHFISSHLMKADAVMGISRSVVCDFQRYTDIHYPQQPMPKLSFFHLGVDRRNFMIGDVRDSVKSVFNNQQKKRTFLMVSTIEPRKNHSYLLDCFEQLWRDDLEVNLVFIGKVGWEVANLMRRINQHPQQNQMFFVFHDANDAELSYAYEHSTALIFPSHAEGFGLPIIEALEHSLPVIASDIPVHREVGGDVAMYINTSTTESLLDLVKVILAEGVPLEHQPHNYKWLSWEESAQQLIDRVLAMRNDS